MVGWVIDNKKRGKGEGDNKQVEEQGCKKERGTPQENNTIEKGGRLS